MTTVRPSTAPFDLHPASRSNADRDRRTVELAAEASAGELLDRQRVLNEAIELNLPLARYLASKYQRRGIPYDDLVQVAYLGLTKAVRGFCPARGTSFAAYAIPTIRGELRRHFRDAGWTVRPPRRIQELQARAWSAEAELTQVLQRSPTVNEIAKSLDLELDDVLEASSVDSCFTPNSLDAPSPGGGDGPSHEPGFDDPAYSRAEARLVLEPALRTLGERDRRILDLRFVHGLTQGEIGQAVGLSQMQVSRILGRVLSEMRDAIDGEAA